MSIQIIKKNQQQWTAMTPEVNIVIVSFQDYLKIQMFNKAQLSFFKS